MSLWSCEASSSMPRLKRWAIGWAAVLTLYVIMETAGGHAHKRLHTHTKSVNKRKKATKIYTAQSTGCARQKQVQYKTLHLATPVHSGWSLSPLTPGSCFGTFCLDRSGENRQGRVRSRAESTTRTGYWSIRAGPKREGGLTKKKISVPEVQTSCNKSLSIGTSVSGQI